MADEPPQRARRSCRGGPKDPRDVEKERREAERRTKELEKIAKRQKKARDAQAALRASGQIEITGDGYTINKPAGTIHCTAGVLKDKCWKDTEENREAFKASADASKQRNAYKRTRQNKKDREENGFEISNPGAFLPGPPSEPLPQKPKTTRPPPPEGTSLLVRWSGDNDSSREDKRYACVLQGGMLHGDWDEPVPFDPDDDDWRYGEGAYKRRALDFVARFCANIPQDRLQPFGAPARTTVAAPPSAAAFCRPVTPLCEAPMRPRRPFGRPSKPYSPGDLKTLEKSILRKAPRDPWTERYTVPAFVNCYSLPPGTEAKYHSNCEKLADWKEKPTGSTANMLRLCAKLVDDRCALLCVRRALPMCVPAPPEIFFGLQEGAPSELAKFLYVRGKELASEKGISLLAAANEL